MMNKVTRLGVTLGKNTVHVFAMVRTGAGCTAARLPGSARRNADWRGPTVDMLYHRPMVKESDQTLMVALSAVEATKLVLLAAAEYSSTLSKWEETEAARVKATLAASMAWTARGTAKKLSAANEAAEAAESMKAALPNLLAKLQSSLLSARIQMEAATRAVESAQSTGAAQEPGSRVVRAIAESATNVLDSVGSAVSAMPMDADVAEFLWSRAAKSARSAIAAAESAVAAAREESVFSIVVDAANAAVGMVAALPPVLLAMVEPSEKPKLTELLHVTE